MSTPARIAVMLAGLAGLALVYVVATLHIPPAGDYRGPYGNVINAVAPSQRTITDTVSAVNFDYRGVDTIGEEFVLFVAVAGVTVVLRHTRDEEEARSGGQRGDQEHEAELPPTSDAVRIAALACVGAVLVLGLYIVGHGQLSPGGGFQGGVVLSSALLLVYLAGRYGRMRRLGPATGAEILEALGAGGFVLVGIAALATGAAFLTNVLPLGTSGYLTSGGTITLINALVGCEVCGGVVIIVTEFLEQALQIRARGAA